MNPGVIHLLCTHRWTFSSGYISVTTDHTAHLTWIRLVLFKFICLGYSICLIWCILSTDGFKWSFCSLDSIWWYILNGVWILFLLQVTHSEKFPTFFQDLVNLLHSSQSNFRWFSLIHRSRCWHPQHSEGQCLCEQVRSIGQFDNQLGTTHHISCIANFVNFFISIFLYFFASY